MSFGRCLCSLGNGGNNAGGWWAGGDFSLPGLQVWLKAERILINCFTLCYDCFFNPNIFHIKIYKINIFLL